MALHKYLILQVCSSPQEVGNNFTSEEVQGLVKMVLTHPLPSYLAALLLISETSIAVDVRSGTVYATENVMDNNQSVLLGALFPIHRLGSSRGTCGEIRDTTIQLVESMVFAIETINNDSSLLPNVSLAFNIRDTCTSVNYALQQSVGYIQSVSNSACDVNGTLGVTGVLGAAQSSISQACANLFGLFEIPQVSYASTAPTLSSDQFQYFFRTIPSDNFQAQVLADIIGYFNWNFIVLLHSDDLYGIDGAEAFRRELISRNSTACVANQIVLSINPSNLEEAVNQMTQKWVSNATVVVLFAHRTYADGIFHIIQRRQASDSEFPLTNITWIGSDSWSATFSSEFYPLARGMLGVLPAARTYTKFNNYFSQLTPTNNERNPWFSEFWELQFNCSLGNNTQLSACDLANQDLQGIAQFSQVPLVAEAVEALAQAVDALITANCPNGKLCPTITIPGGALNGSMLRLQLLNVSFDSKVGGRIQFDKNGDISLVAYMIQNLQVRDDNKFEFVDVGMWSKEVLTITKNIEWITGSPAAPTSVCSLPCKSDEVARLVPDQTSCCFTCEVCMGNTISKNGECLQCSLGSMASLNRTACELLPLTHLTWSKPWGIIIVCLTCLGIVATSAVTVIFLAFHKHEIIRATSRELSSILLFGILLCYIVPFLYIATPSSAICGLQRFSIGFCFAISYSALLIRTNRIHRIFNREPTSVNKPLKYISPLSQVLFTLGLIGIQVLISVIWLIAEPPKTVIRETETSRELRCGSNPYIGFSVFLGYNFALLILSTYYAFRTRKVPANFNEAKFINITLYTICIIWLAFVPIHFATAEISNLFRTVTLVLGIIFSAGTTLGCLFVSKIFILLVRIRKEKKQETENKSQMPPGTPLSNLNSNSRAN